MENLKRIEKKEILKSLFLSSIVAALMTYKHTSVLLSIAPYIKDKGSFIISLFFFYNGIFLFLFRYKYRLILVNTFIIFHTLLLFGTLKYFEYFQSLPHIWLFKQISFFNVAVSVTFSQFVQFEDLRFLIDMAFFNLLYFSLKGKIQQRARYFFLRASYCSLILFFVTSVYVWTKKNIYYGSIDLHVDTNQAYALSLYGFSSILYKDIRDWVRDSFDSTKSEKECEFTDGYPWRKEKKLADRVKREYSLVMIQVESLDFNIINKVVNGVEVTPQLNRLAKENLFFTNFYPHHIAGTADAEFTALNSLLPYRTSVFMRYPFMKFPSLPSQLKKHGYYSVIMHSNHGVYWNRTVAFRNMQFDKFYDSEYFADKSLPSTWAGIYDEYFFRKSLDVIRKLRNPFLAYLITSTSHSPFKIKEEYLEREFDTSSEIVNNYFQAMSYVDYAIGEFVDDIRHSGLGDRTIVFIYGDHTAHVDDEIYSSKHVKFGRIPLIIIFPEPQQKVIDKYGSAVDIPPTVFDILGLDIPSEWVGQSLLRDDRDGYVVQNTSPPYVINREGLWRFMNGQFRHTETGALLADSGYYLDIIRYSECKIKGKIKVN